MSANPFEPGLSPDSIVQPKKRGFTWVEFFVVIAIIGVLVGLLLPARRTAREAARRMQCTNNLKQIALALQNYESVYKSFPPAFTVDAQGNPLHSWRTLLLPFLEQKALYEKIDLTKPWNDPVNAQAVGDQVPPVFLCPSNHATPGKTIYKVVVDPRSCFPGATCVASQQITDGSSNTITVVEVPVNSGVEWMSPQDTTIDAVTFVHEKSETSHLGVFHAVFADGHIQALDKQMDVGLREAMITIAAGDGDF